MKPLGAVLIVIGSSACAGKPAAPASEDRHPAFATCITANGSHDVPDVTLVDGGDRATVSASGPECRRTFTLESTAELRDDRPKNPRVFSEEPGQSTVSTRNRLFDALYALAHAEVREASVDSIRDGAFAHGEPVPCDCFETGRLWTYVWTRDTSYAVDLALASVDPLRARNSLDFKLSERRTGGDLQVVQDTGSGGSYPVSTDRVVWALGAGELLKWLDDPVRAAFLARTYRAVRNTVEHDRAVAFDAHDGLYRGETSFLDWREQSYPAWTANDTVHIGTSKALSTNILHLRILELSAGLAREQGDGEPAGRYAGWARALASAVRQRFWLEDRGLFSSFIMTPYDSAPVRRYDLLGSALAVLSGVATDQQARRVVASYPHLAKGPPVIWPQQPGVPIYHNRAMWPFVTAYWLRAAKAVRNDAVVNLGIESLMRGAALNLSNMENFEVLSGDAWVDDGELSGPVVNSQRQLWSVAGYLSMVHDVIFGLEAGERGIRFLPYVTREIRHALFADADSIVLNNFRYRGRTITVVVGLPPVTEDRAGAYRVGEIRLNGKPVTRDFVPAASLEHRNVVAIALADTPEPAAPITLVEEPSNPQRLFSPRAPVIRRVAAAEGGVRIEFEHDSDAPEAVAFNVWRDGVLRASGLAGSVRSWIDTDPGHYGCYTVEASFRVSGNTSHRARPVCHGQDGEPTRVPPTGDEDAAFAFVPRHTGDTLLRLVYGNDAGPINTGITCAVAHLEVRQAGNGDVVAEGYLMMPHLGTADPGRQGLSSPLRARLRAGERYTVALAPDSRAINMSAFAHFARYTGGAGGHTGPEMSAEVIALDVVPAR